MEKTFHNFQMHLGSPLAAYATALQDNMGCDDNDFLDKLAEISEREDNTQCLGFYLDELSFFDNYKDAIITYAKGLADDFGQTLMEMVHGFRCFNGKYSLGKVEYALLTNRKDDDLDHIRKVMVWLIIEQIAFAYNDWCYDNEFNLYND